MVERFNDQAVTEIPRRPRVRGSYYELLKDSAPKMPGIPCYAMEVLSITAGAECTPDSVLNVVNSYPQLGRALLQYPLRRFQSETRASVTAPPLSKLILDIPARFLREFVLILALRDIVPAAQRRERDLPKRIWIHSIATAYLARAISKFDPAEGEREELFTAALFHESGKLLNYADLSRRDRTDEDDSSGDDQWIESLCDEAHEILGERLVEAWGFSPAVSLAIQQYKHPPSASGPVPISALIHVADKVTQGRGDFPFQASSVSAVQMLAPYRKVSDGSMASILSEIDDELSRLSRIW